MRARMSTATFAIASSSLTQEALLMEVVMVDNL